MVSHAFEDMFYKTYRMMQNRGGSFRSKHWYQIQVEDYNRAIHGRCLCTEGTRVKQAERRPAAKWSSNVSARRVLHCARSCNLAWLASACDTFAPHLRYHIRDLQHILEPMGSMQHSAFTLR